MSDCQFTSLLAWSAGLVAAFLGYRLAVVTLKLSHLKEKCEYDTK